ncbi:MAG: S9 family peptidase [Burkholderiaceae bacterium]|nr:S9 family peptidase [Burkholderiaceae bacterium]
MKRRNTSDATRRTGRTDARIGAASARASSSLATAMSGAGRGVALALSSLLSASLAPSALAASPPLGGVFDSGLPHRPIPGVLSRLVLAGDQAQSYYVYVPRVALPGAPLVVAVHGISRNALEHAKQLAPFAEQYGVVLVAPLFDESRFPDYQRLGRTARGERADLMLERIVSEVGRTTPADTRRLFLFGFSGGGQFVHRFAMAHPERVASYVVGAAGWYTFPDDSIPFPRGTLLRKCLSDVCFDPELYLRVPALVLVGERDVHEGSAMRHTTRVNEQQGDSRLERGEHWVRAMQAAARDRGYDTHYEFAALPRSGHSFNRAARRGRMGERIFGWFFGTDRVLMQVKAANGK